MLVLRQAPAATGALQFGFDLLGGLRLTLTGVDCLAVLGGSGPDLLNPLVARRLTQKTKHPVYYEVLKIFPLWR